MRIFMLSIITMLFLNSLPAYARNDYSYHVLQEDYEAIQQQVISYRLYTKLMKDKKKKETVLESIAKDDEYMATVTIEEPSRLQQLVEHAAVWIGITYIEVQDFCKTTLDKMRTFFRKLVRA